MTPVEEIRRAAQFMREEAHEEWHEAVADLLDTIALAIGAQRIRHNGKVADGTVAVARAYLGGAS